MIMIQLPSKKYWIYEVICEETKEHRGESIVRAICDTREEAETKMASMKPKENGVLTIEAKLY